MPVQEKYTKGVPEVYEKCMAAGLREAAPERIGVAAGTSTHVVAEAGDARQEPLAFRDAQGLAACLPSVSMLLTEAGDGRCRPTRLQCPVADLLAGQRCQTPVHPRVCQIQ